MNAEASELVISLGSNYGDRSASIRKSIDWLSNLLINAVASEIYSTPDCNGGHNEYMNAVVRGRTFLSLDEMENECKRYEESCGRNHEARDAGRVPIDIDVVIYKGEIIRQKDFERMYFRIGYDLI